MRSAQFPRTTRSRLLLAFAAVDCRGSCLARSEPTVAAAADHRVRILPPSWPRYRTRCTRARLSIRSRNGARWAGCSCSRRISALLRIAEPQRHVAASNGCTRGACWALALLLAWEPSWQVAERTAGVWASLAVGPRARVDARVARPARRSARSGRSRNMRSRYRVFGAAPLVIATVRLDRV